MKMIEGLCSLARLKRFFTNLGSEREVFQKLNSNMLLLILWITVMICTWLTFHSLPAIWRQGQTRRWRRRWSCLLLWQQLSPDMTFLYLVVQRARSLSMEFSSLSVKQDGNLVHVKGKEIKETRIRKHAKLKYWQQFCLKCSMTTGWRCVWLCWEKKIKKIWKHFISLYDRHSDYQCSLSVIPYVTQQEVPSVSLSHTNSLKPTETSWCHYFAVLAQS